MCPTSSNLSRSRAGASILALVLRSTDAAPPQQCPASFDPEGIARHDRIASWHDEYSYRSATVNCQGMDQVTMRLGDHLVAAVENKRYAGGQRCGTCARVAGPRGSAIVKIIDQCPTCSARGRGLDLSQEAFRQINDGNLDDGLVDVSWRTVSCPVDDANPYFKYRFKDGSNQWWMQLQILFNVDPIEKVYMAFESEEYERYWEMQPTDHSFWKFKLTPSSPARPYKGRMKILLTSTAGQEVTDILSGINDYSVLVTGSNRAQFLATCPATASADTGGGYETGTCGRGSRGNGICANGECCSQFGWCGTSPAHCDDQQAPTESAGSPWFLQNRILFLVDIILQLILSPIF